MSLIFIPETHTYKSLLDPDKEWVSVTKVISKFKQPFDSKKISSRVSKNKKSKWYGKSEEAILKAWEDEKNRSLDLGNWYHNKMESFLLNSETVLVNDTVLKVHKPEVDENGYKISHNPSLEEGVYPELFIYNNNLGICGQSDIVEIINNKIYITDYKTSKDVKKESFVNWEGISSKMLSPLSHLDDCNFNHYSLQLNLYLYMIKRQNPHLEYGKMTIKHITFEEDGTDDNGYPIYKIDDAGEPIIKNIEDIDVPLMTSEIKSILEYI